MLFDSRMAFFASASLRRIVGRASASRPCSVRTHHARAAPAAKNREVSESPTRSFSSEIAQLWSSLAQWQDSPFCEQIPWPYCVILKAVQSHSGRAAMRPATTLVLPTLRECPPTTMSAISYVTSGMQRMQVQDTEGIVTDRVSRGQLPAGSRRFPGENASRRGAVVGSRLQGLMPVVA